MIFIPAKILVVEDSLVQSKMIQASLCEEGHDVIVSQDGLHILDIIASEKIDITLLDVVLPTYDGFELLSQILNCNETCNLPVIMVTGLTSGHDVKRALDMGAFDYVKKPIDPIELIARVNAALRLKSKQDLLKEYAVRDKLTNLYNRTFFDDALLKMVDEIKLLERGMSLAMLDCDFFKRINDCHGHVAGDKVLAAVANVLNKSVKSTDIVCRYGGEEFCMVLTNTSLHQGFMICERIRKNVEKLRFNFDRAQARITVSLGVAHMGPKDNVTALQLIDEADQALYAAKSMGRNRVEALKRKVGARGV